MTSKRAYAVAALALSASLPLGACSRTKAPDEAAGSRTAATQPSASPAPGPVNLSIGEAKAVALLGQRATGNVYPNAPRKELLDWTVCGEELKTPAASTWLSYVTEEPEGAELPAEDLAKIDVGGAFSSVSLLPDETAQAALDANLKAWSSTCADKDGPVTLRAIAVEGADSLMAFGQSKPKASAPNKYLSVAMARTGNAQILCYLEGKNAATADTAANACIKDMVSGARAIAAPLDAPDPSGAKTLLASVVAQAGAKSEVTFEDTLKVQPPCGAMKETVMTAEAVNANFRPAGTDMYRPPTASAGVFAMKDAAAAKAKVAESRTTFGACTGDYVFTHGPNKVPAHVHGVDDVSFGDGGFAIRDEIRFPKQKPEQGYSAIFSVGPFVVQVDGWQVGQGEAVARAIAEAAR